MAIDTSKVSIPVTAQASDKPASGNVFKVDQRVALKDNSRTTGTVTRSQGPAVWVLWDEDHTTDCLHFSDLAASGSAAPRVTRKIEGKPRREVSEGDRRAAAF